MYLIRKSFKFEAAHVLANSYSKECQNIHGHSYLVEVFFKTDKLNSDGMIIDLKMVKEIVSPLIDQWDHSLIVPIESADAPNLYKREKNVLIVSFNPTAENMAKFIYDYVKARTNKVSKVRVHETETGYAEYWEEYFLHMKQKGE